MNKYLYILLLLCIISIHLSAQPIEPVLKNRKVYFNIDSTIITLPLNKVLFANEITDNHSTLKDSVNFKIQAKQIKGYLKDQKKIPILNHLPLAAGQSAVFKFKKNKIKNIPGADIYVFTGKAEGDYQVAISKDGNQWIDVGKVNTSKKYINLGTKVKNEETFSFIKISNPNSSTLVVVQIAVIKSKHASLGKAFSFREEAIHTEEPLVYFQIKDFRRFDGDRISLIVNGKKMIKNKLLTKWNKFIEIPLRYGENKITIKAENEGLTKPNTVDIKLIDGIKINIGSFRLKKNKKKSLTIFREY